MLGNSGIQPVTLAFNNSRNCFLCLSPNLVSRLSLRENEVLELSCGAATSVFLSWVRGAHTAGQEDTVGLSRRFGEKLGLREGEEGFLRPCVHLQSVQQVFVEPLSSDDWEILELHSTALEQQLLDQIRVVFPDGVFPVWVDQHTVIYIKIASLSPFVQYGRLEQFTELVVSPKLRPGSKHHSHVSQEKLGPKSQAPQSQQNFDLTSSSGSSSTGNNSQPESLSSGVENSERHSGAHWGDLKSLVRYMFTGRFEPVKELPAVPTVPVVFQDCVVRVCGTPPTVISHLDLSHGDVHLLPWDYLRHDYYSAQKPVLTYGKLFKINSPKETRERVKQAMERKKNSSSSPQDAEERKEGSVVVRMLCHNADKLQVYPGCPLMGEIYCGKVWIPSILQTRLNIEPHSAVKVCPLTSCTPKVAMAISLQPLQPLAESEGEEDVQSAFLGWLHALSHQPLACLTGRTNNILLQCTEGKSEFVLTVLKPEPEQKPGDEIFLLSTIVLNQTNIQVVKEPHTSNNTTVQPLGESPAAGLPSLSSLGGVDNISSSAFEHIYHSLVGGPLSRELVSTGRGLRSGAVLIMGAKGSGKSALSRAICRKAVEELDAHVEVVDCKKLRGKRADTVRQKLEEVFEQAVWRQPSVVLLDDLDELTGAATSPEHEQGQEAVLCLHIAQSLKDVVDDLVERCSLVALVVTAQNEHSLHPRLREVQGSHFFQTFCKIQAPNQTQRVDILRSLMLSKNIIPEDSPATLDLDAIAMKTEGYFPRDFNILLNRAIHASVACNGSNDDVQGLCLSNKDFQQALQGFTPPTLWGIKLHVPGGVGMDRVGGLHDARQLLMDTILLPAKYPRLFARLPIRPCSGILLYGAPGTGKTLLAGAVAKESGMNFIAVKGPELLSKYIGASEQAVREVFQRAQTAKPCILFFDEFDSLAPRRGHDSTGVTDRVVNQLLTQLDGVEGLEGVYVLAATSRPDLIDPALLRPGRLDKSLHCPPPDREARLEILKALTHSVPLAADVDLEQIAVASELFTGADLKALLYNAQLEAIHSTLGPGLLPDLGSGSDSDMSLSSLIFLNHSSGSDDSAGEGEVSLEPPKGLLEHGELQPDDPHNNIWRLYFGSSFESEIGNQSSSDLNSQCLSVPTSATHELTGMSGRDTGSLYGPVSMPSVQEGFRELSHEQAEQLQADLNIIKSNYRKSPEDSSLMQQGPSKPGILICQAHLTSALASTRASISRQDWRRYTELYESFGSSRKGKPMFTPGQRVTLA